MIYNKGVAARVSQGGTFCRKENQISKSFLICMKGNFLTEREECFRLTSYQTKQQVVFILKYSFFSLVLPLTLLNKALDQIIARTRKYEWLTHNQAHKWSQKIV